MELITGINILNECRVRKLSHYQNHKILSAIAYPKATSMKKTHGYSIIGFYFLF